MSLEVGTRDLSQGGFPLQMVIPTFEHCPLRKLRLHNCGLGKKFSPISHMELPRELFLQKTLSEISRLVKDTSTPITSLEMSSPRISPPVMKILLTWPNSLMHIKVSRLDDSYYNYTLNDLQKLLDVHQYTLQNIEIGRCFGTDGFSWCPVGIPTLSEYPHLRYVSLSMFNLLTEGPSVAAVKLAAP